jgi:hypothetical protein
VVAALGAFVACGQSFNSGNSGGASGAAGATSSVGGASGGASSGGASGSSTHAGAGGMPLVAGAAGSGGLPGVGGLPTIGGTAGITGVGGAVMGDAGEVPPIPTDGLALWLRADRGVVQTNGVVQQWLDQSGQGMDAIQTASNLQPKFLATGLNNLPTLDFGGAAYMKLPAGFSDSTKGLSWFVVLTSTEPQRASIQEMSNGSEIEDLEIGVYQSIWQYEVQNDNVQSGMVAPEPSLYAVVHRPDETVDLRLDSALIGQTNFALPDKVVREQNFVGQTLYADCDVFQGQISEIVMYDRAVTDKEIPTIEGYLHDHWSFTFAQ